MNPETSQRHRLTFGFAPLEDINELNSILLEGSIAQAIASQQLSGITRKYLSPIRGVQRFFMELDYVVDNDRGGDAVEDLKVFLYELSYFYLLTAI